jgi:hypothetical protein
MAIKKVMQGPGKGAKKPAPKPVAKPTAKATTKPTSKATGTTLKAVQAREKESIGEKRQKIKDQSDAAYRLADSQMSYIRNLKGSSRMSMNQEDSAFNSIRNKGNAQIKRLDAASAKLDSAEYSKPQYKAPIKPIRKTAKKK